jgi:carbon-monoxide dehydrogenase medium subunit
VEISLVNVAVFLRLAADGRTIAQARIALGAVAPTPMRAHQAEAVLQGRHGDQKTFAAAARAAAQECRPIDDHRGSAWYRREMVEVLTRRMLAQAWDQAQGG